MAIILETPRLVLREMTPADLDFVAAMLADPEVVRFYPRCYSRQEAEGWVQRQLDRYARDGHGLWLAQDRVAGTPVGQVGLIRQIVNGVEEPEIAYLIHRPYWRRGLATEAAAAVRDHAFDTLGKPHVISLIRPENRPSRRVATKIGLRPGPQTVMHGSFEHLVYTLARADRGL
jgi:ribosomal-protein-alanine N-acetyltransferase